MLLSLRHSKASMRSGRSLDLSLLREVWGFNSPPKHQTPRGRFTSSDALPSPTISAPAFQAQA